MVLISGPVLCRQIYVTFKAEISVSNYFVCILLIFIFILIKIPLVWCVEMGFSCHVKCKWKSLAFSFLFFPVSFFVVFCFMLFIAILYTKSSLSFPSLSSSSTSSSPWVHATVIFLSRFCPNFYCFCCAIFFSLWEGLEINEEASKCVEFYCWCCLVYWIFDQRVLAEFVISMFLRFWI